MKILVVEDDVVSRRLLCEYLAPLGPCEVAVNGSEALETIRQALAVGLQFDLICLDIMMPGMGGHEALAGIRALEREIGLGTAAGAKVVMTTALDDRDNIRHALNSAADGYLVKPIERRALLATLRGLGLELPQTT